MDKTLPPILIIGGGLAGVFCALKLAPHPVAILAPGNIGASGASYWAQGGIAAAVEENDSPEKHTADTIAAGAGLVDPDIALTMTRDARKQIDTLITMGAPFDRHDDGRLSPSQEAAHSYRRIIRVKGDGAGKAVMETLKKQILSTPSIQTIEDFTAQDILTFNGEITGIRGRNTAGAVVDIPCSALVLATGGIGHLYRVTTNPTDACGNGVAMAARAGAIIADAEFVQFHPTAINIHRDPAPLATESLRGEGATIIDQFGDRFLKSVHQKAELAPRDIVSRAIFAHIAEGYDAFLDCRLISDFRDRFPTVFASCMHANINPQNTPIPIAPAAHYHMGGVWTDSNGQTTIKGLWAVGEVASTGVHGANRLASNSLLEALVFSDRLASDILKKDLRQSIQKPQYFADKDIITHADQEIIEILRDQMTKNVGVIRNASGLISMMRDINKFNSATRSIEVKNRLMTALLITASAFLRKESRGAHYRSDYPAHDVKYLRRSMMSQGEAIKILQEVL